MIPADPTARPFYVQRIDIVRHGDRTKKIMSPDGASMEIQSGYVLSDFGREMNIRQASAIRDRDARLPPFDTVEIWGSSVGPFVPYPGIAGSAVGRSGYTAQQYADVVIGTSPRRAVMRSTDLFNYNFPTAKPMYKHTDVYDEAFISELRRYFRDVGIGAVSEVASMPSQQGRAPNTIGQSVSLRLRDGHFIPIENTAVAALRDRISPSYGMHLADLSPAARLIEEQFIIDQLINYAADKAQQTAANALIKSATTDQGRRFVREYAGGLAFALMHYVERRSKNPTGCHLAIFGVHGPILESLLMFALRQDRDAKEIDGLTALAEIGGPQHTSESYRLALRMVDSSWRYFLTAHDASKIGVRDLPLDMDVLRQLAIDLRSAPERAALRSQGSVSELEFGALDAPLIAQR